MPLIDFHVHLFPDKIAGNALSKLRACVLENGRQQPSISSLLDSMEQEGCEDICYTNATVSDTLDKLRQWQVDRAVILNIATNPKQQTNVNDFAAKIQEEHPQFISFGSVHPDAPNALEELERIQKLGMRGVKLHPDYQGFLIQDRKMDPVYDACQQLGLILVFHAGFDVYSPNLIHASPEGIAQVHSRFPHLKMVAAHFGGILCWDDVETYLAGRDLYLDTAYCAGLMDPQTARRILSKHPPERVLFASDCPWQSAAHTVSFIESLDLPDSLREKIYYQNALELLKLPSP